MKTAIAIIILTLFSAVGASAQSSVNDPFTFQKACRAQSFVVLHETRDIWLADSNNHIGFASVTSRFDSTTGICYARTDFVIIVKNGTQHDGVITSTTVQDAFGGTSYAADLWLNTQGKQAWEVPNLTTCSIKLRGHTEITCKTNEEFMAIIDRDFGL